MLRMHLPEGLIRRTYRTGAAILPRLTARGLGGQTGGGSR